MLSRFGSQPFLVAGLFLVTAVSLANVSLLAVAAIPLLMLAGAALTSPATLADAKTTLSVQRVYVGQEIRVQVTCHIARGYGPLDVHIPLPPTFRVTDGSNLHHRWVKPGDTSFAYEFKMVGDRRGIFEVGACSFESTHPALLGGAQKGSVGNAPSLRVMPRWSRLRRMRAPRTKSKNFIPELDMSKTGVATSEFQDIRPYQWGDAPKTVNWKASARLGELGGEYKLLVNEYEREGRKMAWIFLDAGKTDVVGTNLDNAFERRVEAAYSIASYYLQKGFTIGFSLYNYDKDVSLYPDSSSRQKVRILELLNRLGPAEESHTLLDAVNVARSHLGRTRSVAFVISSLGWDVQGEEPGLRKLRTHLGRRRGRVPISLIHVNPFGLVPYAAENHLARVTSLLQEGSLRSVRKLGIQAIEWNPARRSLASLLRGVTG